MPMRKHRYLALAAACAATSVALASCGSSATKTKTTTGGAFNAATNAVVNPSNHKGGTLLYLNPSDWDSPDPGNTYYGFSWDFLRLYARTLTMFKPAPGLAGEKLVPDLATSLGQVSNHGLTWTYHLKPGLKFEDGSPVTSQDVKYAIERTGSYFPKAKGQAVLNGGPTYWGSVLTDPNYPGAFYDKSPGKLGFKGISTPDASTIVFHLQKPFAEFDFLASESQTAPVPPAKDKGINYLRHPLSTGPYMFQGDYVPGKGLTLVKNPNWSASTDQYRKQLVDKLQVTVSVPPAQLDNRLISGQADTDVHGLGISPNDSARVLNNPKYKANADDVLNGFFNYVAIIEKVKPFDNVHCRMAVLYAADHAELQTAYGGKHGAPGVIGQGGNQGGHLQHHGQGSDLHRGHAVIRARPRDRPHRHRLGRRLAIGVRLLRGHHEREVHRARWELQLLRAERPDDKQRAGHRDVEAHDRRPLAGVPADQPASHAAGGMAAAGLPEGAALP